MLAATLGAEGGDGPAHAAAGDALAALLRTSASVTELAAGEQPLGLPGLKAVADALADEANPTHLRELDLPDVGVDQAGAARLLQAVRRNGELARLDLRRNELPPKVVKMLAKQARGFRKESDDDVPLELLLEPQEKSE